MKNKVFAKYYKENFTSLRGAGRTFDCAYQSVKTYLTGVGHPSLRTAKRIAKITKNKVPVSSWGYKLEDIIK